MSKKGGREGTKEEGGKKTETERQGPRFKEREGGRHGGRKREGE